MSDVIEFTAPTEPTLSLEVGSDGVSPSQFANLERWLRDQWSAVEAEADTAIDGAESVDATVTKVGDTATITVTDRNGTVHTATVTDGEDATIAEGSIDWDKLAPDVTNPLDRLTYRLSNLLTATPSEAEVVTVADAAQTPMAGLALYGKSTQDGTPTPDAPVAIQSVGGNLLPNNGTSQTSYGVTFTVNEDDSVTCNGTATAQARFDIGRDSTMLPAGTYVCGEGTGSGYTIDVYKVVDGTATRIRSSFGTFTLDADTSVFVRIVVASGVMVSATISPYIYAGSTTYPYVPYGCVGLWAQRTSDASQSVTITVPLGGRFLRSLPDGTRDEVTVDERGHAVLVQRVGSYTVTGSEALVGGTELSNGWRRGIISVLRNAPSKRDTEHYGTGRGLCTHAPYIVDYQRSYLHAYAHINDVFLFAQVSTNAELLAAYTGAVIQYPLATPITHDLGTIDPVPLVGPDLTAQAVPSAPFALTYERDLNATLARLEAAIADIATS